MMQVDSTLKANSDALPVKTKGVAIGMMKYEFGTYRVIFVKPGSGNTNDIARSNLSGSMETATTKSKLYFELLAGGKDTMRSSIVINSVSKATRDRYISVSKTEITLKEEENATLDQWNKNCVAVINSMGASSLWELLYFMQFKPDSSLKAKRGGILKNDSLIIDILPIRKWENKKSPAFYSVVGFDFKLNNESIASVQTPNDTFRKKFVWIKNTLDERIKNVLATAIVALIGFHDAEFEP